MITGAAFVPQAPLLIPAIAQQGAPDLTQVRSACRAAVTRIAVPGSRFVVIGSGPAGAVHEPSARGSLAGYGVPLELALGSDEPGPVGLPLSLTIGAWLLRDALGPNCGAVGYTVGPDRRSDPATWTDEEADWALLVMGDGSARRCACGPRSFDERAAAFDATIVAALRSGDGARLRLADPRLDQQLLAAGAVAWDEAASLLAGRAYDAELLYDDAPFGVGYFVAAWTHRV